MAPGFPCDSRARHGGGIRVDSLVLRNRDSALVVVTGDVPTTELRTER
jgi:hypothetical protein